MIVVRETVSDGTVLKVVEDVTTRNHAWIEYMEVMAKDLYATGGVNIDLAFVSQAKSDLADLKAQGITDISFELQLHATKTRVEYETVGDKSFYMAVPSYKWVRRSVTAK
jgi:hypothetical protein